MRSVTDGYMTLIMRNVTEKDAADFAEAERLVEQGMEIVKSGRKLRQRVNTRIRNRSWRERKAMEEK